VGVFMRAELLAFAPPADRARACMCDHSRRRT
jgi:hypothetical protein